ncbi:UNVERIFIED_CONTAM: hypothetical protein FKN15_066744 [Acipenser sinensis]
MALYQGRATYPGIRSVPSGSGLLPTSVPIPVCSLQDQHSQLRPDRLPAQRQEPQPKPQGTGDIVASQPIEPVALVLAPERQHLSRPGLSNRGRHSLKVREHKVLGPYVDGLSRLAVACFKDIESLMSEGNKSRTVAATNMNEESSRSHAVFNIILTHTLCDLQGRHSLKVREHKVLGPYVDGLSRLAVACFKDIESLMSEGNKSRTVAATNMNEESSRSHAVFNIILTHTLCDLQSGTVGEKVSKLSLVDLAGSERAAKTGAAGERLKEGSNINKSLSTLGLVISALAEQSSGKNKNKFVPYRDSVLTWLLKDSLGGNSRTAMVATVSPAADNYDETLSTLRYADRAKNIVNHAVVNEDPNARITRQLREEVEKLREQLTEAESMKAPELKDRLEESEKLIQEMMVTWEEKLRKTESIAQERQKQLESLGISLQSSGIRVGEDKCFLVNLNADPALNELLVYYLKDKTLVGSADSQDIQLCGMGIQAEHCVIDITSEGLVILAPHSNSRTCVNGSPVTSPVQLHHGDRILWGNNHFFSLDFKRLRESEALSPDTAVGLVRKVWFDLQLNLAQLGCEGVRQLTETSFEIRKDENTLEYVCLAYNEYTNSPDTDTASASMAAFPLTSSVLSETPSFISVCSVL